MSKTTFTDALVETLYGEMCQQKEISVIGSAYLLGPGVQCDALNKLRSEFADRVIDEPPIAEAAIASLGIGAAMAGARPFVHFGRASFAFEAWSQIVNEAANTHYITGGQVNVPVVLHMFHGLAEFENAQHCYSPQAMFWNCPGLEIVLPSTPADMKGLLKTAIKSNNPTIILNHTKMMAMESEVSDDDYEIPFGVADIKREGKDVTVFASSYMVHVALEAAKTLEKEGIDVEVVDPRTLVPFDKETLFTSIQKTGRLVVVDETNNSCGVASEVISLVVENIPTALKSPVKRISRPDIPVSVGNLAQTNYLPSVSQIIDAVKQTLA